MELPFETYDVFTTTRFKGNPLAVVTIPPGVSPTQEQKQIVAREFNLSETVFIHDIPPTAKVDSTSRKFDIFLTTAEIPFAGHPTIGTAVSLLGEGVRTLVAKAGELKIEKTGDARVRVEIPFNLRLHAKKLKDVVAVDKTVAAASDNVIRKAELAAPVHSIVNGMTFILVELPDLKTLAKVEFTKNSTDELCDQGWKSGFISCYYFVRTGEEDGKGQKTVKLRTRMLEESFEDPATGSAACCLCSYLSTVEGGADQEKVMYEVTQGVEMGRESNISVEVDSKGGKVNKVFLAGSAVRVMTGSVTV